MVTAASTGVCKNDGNFALDQTVLEQSVAASAVNSRAVL
jgi:hypothetical protein